MRKKEEEKEKLILLIYQVFTSQDTFISEVESVRLPGCGAQGIRYSAGEGDGSRGVPVLDLSKETVCVYVVRIVFNS